MEHLATSTIILNAAVQFINLLIFFGVFYFFFAGPIVEAVEKRRKMLDQFKNADEILQKKLQEAEEQKKALIDEGLAHKAKLLEEAKKEAEQVRQSILEQAEREKNNIIEKAKLQLDSEKEELEKAWEDSVKKAVLLIYQKLISKDTQAVEKYLENVKDFK